MDVGVVDQFDTEAVTASSIEASIKSIVKLSGIDLSKNVLHDLYVKKGLSQREIARICASSKSGIANALVRFKIPPRKFDQEKKRGSSNPPYGMERTLGRVVENPLEQVIISQIIALKNSGESNCGITRHLNLMEVPTKRKIGSWHAENIRQILIRDSNFYNQSAKERKSK